MFLIRAMVTEPLGKSVIGCSEPHMKTCDQPPLLDHVMGRSCQILIALLKTKISRPDPKNKIGVNQIETRLRSISAAAELAVEVSLQE